MRDFKNMKRQRGRNRGGGQGGGGRPQQNANRAFESNGPDNVKIRGHAQHVFEKYQQLARDAFSSGDRVLAENYLQHADHYFRLLRTIQPNRSPSEILGRDTMASGLDIDFEEEVEMQADDAQAAAEGGEAGDGQGSFDGRQTDNRQEGVRQEGVRQEGGRQEGGRQDGGRQDRYERDNRQDRYETRDTGWRDRNDRQDSTRSDRDRQDGRGGFDRQDRNRPYNERSQGGARPQDGERGERGERYDSQRNDAQRNDRYEGRRDNRRFDNRRDEGGRDDRNVPRDNRYDARPDGFAEGPQPTLPEFAEAAPAAAPAYVERTEAAPVLRSQDGAMSEAPAFLQSSAPAEGEEQRPRVRRRRAPKSFDTAEAGGEAPSPVQTVSEDG